MTGKRGKIEIEGKFRQNAENKPTFGLMGKIQIEKKHVKTLKIKCPTEIYLISRDLS